jgi:hypothetical protein
MIFLDPLDKRPSGPKSLPFALVWDVSPTLYKAVFMGLGIVFALVGGFLLCSALYEAVTGRGLWERRLRNRTFIEGPARRSTLDPKDDA